MKKILIQYGLCALAVSLMAPLAQAQPQPAGLQAAFARCRNAFRRNTDNFSELNFVDFKPSRTPNAGTPQNGPLTTTSIFPRWLNR